MDYSVLQTLLSKIYTATVEGKVTWTETGGHERFAVKFDTTTVEIEQEVVSVGDAERGEEGSADYFVVVKNEKGTAVDATFLDHDTRDYALLSLADKVFTAAKKSALKPNETINRLLKEIDKVMAGRR